MFPCCSIFNQTLTSSGRLVELQPKKQEAVIKNKQFICFYWDIKVNKSTNSPSQAPWKVLKSFFQAPWKSSRLLDVVHIEPEKWREMLQLNLTYLFLIQHFYLHYIRVFDAILYILYLLAPVGPCWPPCTWIHLLMYCT